MSTAEEYLQKLKLNKIISQNRAMTVCAMALILAIAVFWWLKLIGITMAGEAFCGMYEHVHDEQCMASSLGCHLVHEHTDACHEVYYTCGLEEHIHKAECYSDLQADLECEDDWIKTLGDVEYSESALQNVIEVAKSQLGYRESSLNFKVDALGDRNGYTRYGEWYGNPYGSWSTMFTSFCLRYAGVSGVPISAGAETMRLKWVQKELYQPASMYTPLAGDIVFLDKNGNGTVDATAIVTDLSDGKLSVIEGDCDYQVLAWQYSATDPMIHGYGLTDPASSFLVRYNTFALRAVDASGNEIIAKTVDYDQSLFVETNSFVVYTVSGSQYYAFDGNGNAVPVSIDVEGNITAQVSDPDTLLWSFTYSSTDSYLIRNISTGRYMHAYPNNGSGVTT
ncbi:MAG: hypothetical protein IJZ37_07105, partial [Clostridia bacterium]|nr:hypothetical protein [Clostridia bacterium]